MEAANLMRVNARSGNFAGNGNSPKDKQQQHRQKVLALFGAVNGGNLDAARHAFLALANFDASITASAHYVNLSKLLEAGSIYLAQQLVKDIKISSVKALPPKSITQDQSTAAVPRIDGLHLVDLRA